MIRIPDATLREMIATCIADEARRRGIRLTTNDPREVLLTPLPTDARGNTGTSNLLARFLYAQRDIGIKVLPYAKEGGSGDEMVSQEDHTEEEGTYDWSLQPIEQGEGTSTSDRDLVRKLTRMMRERYQKELASHPLRGHSFVLLKDCPASSYFLATGNTRPKDNLVKFAILARTNSLNTGQVRRIASNEQESGECNCGQLGSLATHTVLAYYFGFTFCV